MSFHGRLTIALTGDSMVSRSLSVFEEEAYLRMRDILKSADVVFTCSTRPMRIPTSTIRRRSAMAAEPM